jgi:hypothetical protein
MSDPLEYVGTGDAGLGSLDEKGMAYRGRIHAYQRIRTVILRNAWLIDHDHKVDEEEGAVETGPDEEASDAASTAEQKSWPHQSDNQDHDNGSSHGAASSGEALMSKASNTGHGRMKTDEWGEAIEAEGEPPPVGETAAEMMGTMSMALCNLHDQGQEYLEADDGPNGGPCHKENFQWNWSDVEYSRHVV